MKTEEGSTTSASYTPPSRTHGSAMRQTAKKHLETAKPRLGEVPGNEGTISKNTGRLADHAEYSGASPYQLLFLRVRDLSVTWNCTFFRIFT
jgi:hypothetical protein